MLHEEPASTERAKGNDDEAGQRGGTGVRVLSTELAQLDAGIVHSRVQLALVRGRQLLGAIKYLQGISTQNKDSL